MMILGRFSFMISGVASLLRSMGTLFKAACLLILISFLLLRVPVLFGLMGFLFFLVAFMSPLYAALVLGRLEGGASKFFASLLPPGTPLWMAPLVGTAETMSYVVRPAVLILRPLLNMSMGALGAATLGGFLTSNLLLLPVLVGVFFYEVFVASVHWFMVVKMLEFSVDH